MSNLPADDELLDYSETVHTTTNKQSIKITSFNDLLLKPELIKAIKDANLEHPSEIQSTTIPKAILGVDILCQGKSGTGKTVIFVLSSLQRLSNSVKQNISPITSSHPNISQIPSQSSTLTSNTAQNITVTSQTVPITPEILVISNTKEMASQIHSEYVRFSKYLNCNIQSFVGGVPLTTDQEKISSNPDCNIVIGTSGRVLDLINRKLLNLSNIRIFIADEIDHLFSTNDHRWSVQQIFLLTPLQKQTMFFTATLSDDIKNVLLLFLKNPFILQVNVTNLTLHGLDQGYLNITNDKKDDKLIELIDNIPAISQCVIFCADKFKCNKLEKYLISQGLPSISITSEYSTDERMLRFNQFKQFNYRFLITTNLMARGIDIAEINLVINYDMPKDANTYLHRVGRAGRFETMGVAISFISSEEDIIVLNEVQERFDVSVKEIKLTN